MRRPSRPLARSPRPSLTAAATLLASFVAGCQEPAPPAGTTANVPGSTELHSQAATLTGFSDQVVFQNRVNPIAVRFASNGKVFVAEESGRIYFYDNLSDTTATLFADLRDQVNSYWDRGMLGFTLDPGYATNGLMYVLYNHDTGSGENGQSVGDRNGTDSCPSPPGGTTDGCATSGRISRLQDPGSGYPITARLDLVTEWPQQFPSHAIGGLAFGPDGQLYATGGDGAAFNKVDYGQYGLPKNPLGDPPGGVGATLSSPTSRGGSLRAQSLRRPAGENVVLNGSVIRIDPATGAASAGNPNIGHTDLDARRIIAMGLRNPYRFAFHPTSGDIWIADVGDNSWEEINRIPAPLTTTPIKNFGWPCFEGAPSRSPWSSFNLCSGVTHTAPYYAYAHDTPVYSGDACGSGGSAITGVAFYPNSGVGNYPTSYRNAMFFSDLPRDCIYVVFPDVNGLPNNATRTNFVSAAANPVDLQIGPNNDLFYVDYGGDGGTTTGGNGKIHRLRYQSPTAVASANPTSGFTPLVVSFNGSLSTPGLVGDTLTYAWDLDGDGQFDDSTAQNPSRTYNTPGTFVTRLKVTDQRGGFGESQPINIVAGSTTTPPEPVITTPIGSLTWQVGDSISFSGSATDAEDGTIPVSGLLWEVIMQHCPSACHEHLVQTFEGVASGSFPAPDHEYPSYLQLRLTATDSHGVATTVFRDLQPQTVVLSFQTVPATSPGLNLGLNLENPAAPFTRTVIKGSTNSLSASSPQTRGSTQYTFQSWSDAGADVHDVVASADASFTATFTGTVIPWVSQDIGAVASAGSWSENGGVHTIAGNGADIWNAADEFRFTHQQLTGDGTITARVTSFSNAGNVNGKAGVMIRQSLGAGAAHLMAAMPPAGTVTVVKAVQRATTGATSTAVNGPAPSFPAWVRVVRAGTSLTAFHSTNGTTFTALGTALTMSAGTVYVGLAVTSHLDGANATALFDNVTITTPAPPGPPSGLTATGGVNQAVLGWTDGSTNETGFKIERKLASAGDNTYAQVGTSAANVATFTNTTVPSGEYSYRVRATNVNGDSAYSNAATTVVTDPAPPAAPTVLTANGGVSQATLGWTDNSNNETGFQVERKVAGADDSTFAAVGTVGANVVTMIDSAVPGGVYTYRVKATSGAGSSGYSNSTDATVTDPPPPAAPSALMASGGVNQATLSWTDNSNNETGFKVERKLAAELDEAYAQVGTSGANVAAFTNSSVPAGDYSYRVRATNAAGDSAYSNSAAATVTAPVPPGAPTNLVATPGNAQVGLTWSAVSGATSYTVKWSTTAGGGAGYSIAQGGLGTTSYTHTGRTNGTTYYYVVTATGAGGEGSSSTEASATPAAPAWLNADIGGSTPAGSLAINGGSYTVQGGGADIQGVADQFHFAYRTVTGNATIIARMSSLALVSGQTFTKGGIMMRDGTAAGAINVFMLATTTATNGFRSQYRPTTGGATAQFRVTGSSAIPTWFRLVRSGNSFTSSTSTNGTTWTTVDTQTIAMPTTFQVGLAVTSHSTAALTTGLFDSVSVTTP
jgi:glucose/arabinose dehydrogenase